MPHFRLRAYLRTPYPIVYPGGKGFILSFAIVFLILFLLQPFGIANIANGKVQMLLETSCVSVLMVGIAIFLLPRLFPRYHRSDRWTLGKQLLKCVEITLLIAVGLWSYYYFRYQQLTNFLVWLLWVAIVALFPFLFLSLWNRTLLLGRRLRQMKEMNEGITRRGTPTLPSNSLTLCFRGTTKESLDVDAADFRYIEAEGNYIRIVFCPAGKREQKLIRATMRQAQEVVAPARQIVRCHRAFLVNTGAVIRVEGNLQGYRLDLEGCDAQIPVSRGYAKEIRRQLIPKE
ncbi:MAG: LytTR family transcriptional regulator [Prevotellaceae bacterium]|jgi:DNA-binding LytR/AlgR family response regulator|nr:LytTR family transcriptional regulator [Prevotellaceae bacterium]